MDSEFLSERDVLRAEIAAAAARLIAEDGADYGTAKRKALKQIVGNSKIRGDIMPDNAQIEGEVRAYNAIFFADTQPQRLRHLRELALRMMQELQEFSPYLTGAVLNGTAGEHSDIHLQLFANSPKDVEIFLLNRNIDFEVSETSHFNRRFEPVETVSFIWRNEGIHLALFALDDMRGMPKSGDTAPERANAAYLERILKETGTE